MCLAMCLKKQEFQADCVYKLGVYKKKVCIHFCVNEWTRRSLTLRGMLILMERQTGWIGTLEVNRDTCLK